MAGRALCGHGRLPLTTLARTPHPSLESWYRKKSLAASLMAFSGVTRVRFTAAPAGTGDAGRSVARAGEALSQHQPPSWRSLTPVTPWLPVLPSHPHWCQAGRTRQRQGQCLCLALHSPCLCDLTALASPRSTSWGGQRSAGAPTGWGLWVCAGALGEDAGLGEPEPGRQWRAFVQGLGRARPGDCLLSSFV